MSSLVSKDPNKIRDGVSKIVANQLNMTKEELEQYTDVFIDNLPLLEKVLQEGFSNFGQEEVDAILGSLGYERKNTTL
mgnify:FL=1